MRWLRLQYLTHFNTFFIYFTYVLYVVFLALVVQRRFPAIRKPNLARPEFRWWKPMAWSCASTVKIENYKYTTHEHRSTIKRVVRDCEIGAVESLYSDYSGAQIKTVIWTDLFLTSEMKIERTSGIKKTIEFEVNTKVFPGETTHIKNLSKISSRRKCNIKFSTWPWTHFSNVSFHIRRFH